MPIRKHVPTPESRQIVKLAAALDRPLLVIGDLIGVKKNTLCKYYAKELKEREHANIAVGGALYKSAMGGNVAAQIFWCKVRLHWKETQHIEHSGELKTKEATPARKRLSPDEWIEMFGKS